MRLSPFSLAEQTYTCAHSVDPDERARNEPSHQDLHCLPFYFCIILTETPICINGHIQIQGWDSSLQKLRDERLTRETNSVDPAF